MKQKKLTAQQLRAYMDRDTHPLIISLVEEMEKRGFKIPDIIKEQCQ